MLGKDDWKSDQMDDADKAKTASADPIKAALPKTQTAKPNVVDEVVITFSEMLRGSPFNKSGKLAELEVNITTPLLDEFLIDPDHRCTMEGKFRADGFTDVSGAAIRNGIFKLFVPSTAEQFYAREMRYEFNFVGVGGRTYRFVGIKDLRDAKPNSGISDWLEGGWPSLMGIKDLRDAKKKSGVTDWLEGAWRSLTTLNATITSDGTEEVTGQLCLSWDQLLKQLSTFKVRGLRNPVDRARQLERFGRLFFGTAFDLYVRDRLHVKGG